MKDLKFNNNLKVARVTAGLTQEELADLAGVARQTIGLIEAGRYNPSLKLCLLLARHTRTSLNELFMEVEGTDAQVDTD
jgi:putative transcriptional regulator